MNDDYKNDLKDFFLIYDADRKSTRLNSSHSQISYAVFCLKKKIANMRHPSYTTYVTCTACSRLLPYSPILPYVAVLVPIRVRLVNLLIELWAQATASSRRA